MLKQETIRTFIAIEIPTEIQAKLSDLQADLAKFIQRASWVKKGNIHLTLKFLGDVSTHRIESISSVLQQIAAAHAPFEMNFSGAGAFPNVRRPRVIWVGMTDGADHAAQLAEDIENSLQQLGFAREKRGFTPHLTLARIRRPTNLGAVSNKFSQYTALDIPSLQVAQFALIHSQLHPRGAIYTPLEKFVLTMD